MRLEAALLLCAAIASAQDRAAANPVADQQRVEFVFSEADAPADFHVLPGRGK